MTKTNATAIEDKTVKTEEKPRVPRIALTTKQQRILDQLIGPEQIRKMNIKTGAGALGISPSAVTNSNKRVYQNFIGLLDVMIKYYPVFERRFKRDEVNYTKLRKLARNIRKE